MCLEPVVGRKPFDELFISKIKEERKRLQGRMLVSSKTTTLALTALY